MLKQLSKYKWELPQQNLMQVPGIIYSSKKMLESIYKDDSLKQIENIACLDGIIKASFGMPDIHVGYGFPIGGVAAFDWETGIISPGGVGYDINCGVRLAACNLKKTDIQPNLEKLINSLYIKIPAGVGSTSSINLTFSEEKKVLKNGSKWAIDNGFGDFSDISCTEEEGCLNLADPSSLSKKALERGKNQLGTLGAGNHFIEVGYVEKIYDQEIANVCGLYKDHITLMIHTGSRGLGHQVCDDNIKNMKKNFKKNFTNIDSNLAFSKINSKEGQNYLKQMSCAANYAWANRQVLYSQSRDIFYDVFNISPKDLNMKLVYDVSHNIAKKEKHLVNGKKKNLCIHRKGATRAFGPGHGDLCEKYKITGQPVLLPGDMGTASYVLVGTQKAMDETFGSTSHGAGRILSRKAAKKIGKGRNINIELEKKGIFIKSPGGSSLLEEMPDAYKDISDVVEVVHESGLAKKVAKLRPLAVIKG